MKIEKFEDMSVWQKAKELVIVTYKIFREHKDFWFRDQIQRASLSVMNNIAEGFERKWNKELTRFLYISKWPCWEVRSMLYIALELGYLNSKEYETMFNMCIEISKMLWWFIKSLKTQPN